MIHRLIITLIAVIYMFSAITPANAVELKVQIPFGHGSSPKKNDTIEKLKNEETKGAGAMIGLIVLGACIVAAAIVIANKADDITDTAEEKADTLANRAEDTYNDYINR